MDFIIKLLNILILLGVLFIVSYFVYRLIKFMKKTDLSENKEDVLKAFIEYRKDMIHIDNYDEVKELDVIIKHINENKKTPLLYKYNVVPEYDLNMSDDKLKLDKKYIITKKK